MIFRQKSNETMKRDAKSLPKLNIKRQIVTHQLEITNDTYGEKDTSEETKEIP